MGWRYIVTRRNYWLLCLFLGCPVCVCDAVRCEQGVEAHAPLFYVNGHLVHIYEFLKRLMNYFIGSA